MNGTGTFSGPGGQRIEKRTTDLTNDEVDALRFRLRALLIRNGSGIPGAQKRIATASGLPQSAISSFVNHRKCASHRIVQMYEFVPKVYVNVDLLSHITGDVEYANRLFKEGAKFHMVPKQTEEQTESQTQQTQEIVESTMKASSVDPQPKKKRKKATDPKQETNAETNDKGDQEVAALEENNHPTEKVEGLQEHHPFPLLPLLPPLPPLPPPPLPLPPLPPNLPPNVSKLNPTKMSCRHPLHRRNHREGYALEALLEKKTSNI